MPLTSVTYLLALSFPFPGFRCLSEIQAEFFSSKYATIAKNERRSCHPFVFITHKMGDSVSATGDLTSTSQVQWLIGVKQFIGASG